MWKKCLLLISLAMLPTSMVFAEHLNRTFDIEVHVKEDGRMIFSENEWAGSRGKNKGLESFSIKRTGNWPSCLNIEYMAHVQDTGDTDWHTSPGRVGTEGQQRRIEAVAFKLIGSCAERYSLTYRCHLQDFGDTEWKQEGQLCGTRGKSRRLEAFQLRLKHHRH